MQKRLTQFGVHKTALTIAVLMAIVTVPFLLLASIPALLQAQYGFLFVVVIAPVFYFIFGYLAAALWCWVYNLLVRKTKLGIVLSFEDPA